ncbi:response regulator transcription factor [Erysipelothrix aquatica]|uniref:response regulator transcription factor n=1 Tax=Erysipelothrix aquatica TaxID=2683714 RepID=UPI00135798E0|nr:response regulator transcription factor [Erysipelothrix aquatica]
MITTLIIDSDSKYLETLSKELEANNYKVLTASSAMEGIEQFAMKNSLLVISEYDLDDTNGIKLLASVKRMVPTARTVLMTTSLTDAIEIEALAEDIDVVWEKNKSINVLLAYMERMFDSYFDKSTQLSLFSISENMLMDVDNQVITKDGVDIPMTPIELGIIGHFLANRGDVVSRRQIIDNIWNEPYSEELERKVDVHIRNIRKKLNLSSIYTVRGKGYRWSENPHRV